MPIRINLLAEAQEAEELRRRDPVKRAIWAGAALVILALAYTAILYSRIAAANSALKRQQAQWTSLEKKYTDVTENQKRAGEVDKKLAALQRASTNRFLWGSTLNALQQTMVENVQILRLRSEQGFVQMDAAPARKDGGGRIIAAARPAQAVEKLNILIDARDLNPAEQTVFKFRNAIASFPYFQSSLPKDGLKLSNVSAPTPDPADAAKSVVNFSLELRYPDIARDE